MLLPQQFCGWSPSHCLTARSDEVNNGTSTPNAGIGHDYISLMGETVNPANGSLSFRLHAKVPPGRQLNFPFSFAYDSGSAYAAWGDGIGLAGLATTSQFLENSGWSYSVPIQSNMGITTYDNLGNPNCTLTTGYVFQDSAGTRYGFSRLVGFTQHIPRQCIGDVDQTSDSVDFYYAGLAESQYGACGQSVTVSDLKLTTYTFPGSTCNDTGGDPFSTLPTSIEDRNGNIVRISNPGNRLPRQGDLCLCQLTSAQ